MSRKQRHIKSQINLINYEEPYAIQKPTTATFISEKTMETNEEKEGVRQTSKTVHDKSGLAQSEEAKGQTETTCFVKIMESKTVGLFA
tara:strand:+ start:335 stop:598 length:264 start_codon:yes stop_codon:yes gene_type:complete